MAKSECFHPLSGKRTWKVAKGLQYQMAGYEVSIPFRGSGLGKLRPVYLPSEVNKRFPSPFGEADLESCPPVSLYLAAYRFPSPFGEADLESVVAADSCADTRKEWFPSPFGEADLESDYPDWKHTCSWELFPSPFGEADLESHH